MDIMSIAAVETAFIHLKDAKGVPLFKEGQPVGVDVYGPASAAYAEVEEEQIARITQRRNENDGKAVVAPRSTRIAETAGDLAKLTVGFRNFTYGTGMSGAQGRELYVAFYRDPKLAFLTKQVSEGIEKWGNFSPV